MSPWKIEKSLLGPEARTAFASLDSVFALEGEAIASDPLSRVLRVELDGRRYYVKRYHGAGKGLLRPWLGRPRVRAEWENLRQFADWGLPAAAVVAWGLERRHGRFQRGVMITAELEGTLDMKRLADTGDLRLKDRRWVAAVSRQLAFATRTLHAHRFAHNNLKWRNLLVDDGTPPRLFLIDCPSGRFWWGPLLRYRIIKDLACLDKVAKYQLSRSQRLAFYLDYAGKRRLDAGDKRRIGKILAFFQGRE